MEDLEKENNQLNQQLAEKEKEIKQLKLDLGMFKSTNEFINRYGIEKAREVLLQSEKTRNQTAIEVLEKVKEYYISNVQWTRHKGMSMLEFIDQQIKSLKGETKDD